MTWYAIKMGLSTFGIFDTFEGESGCKAHLSGKIAESLMANALYLLSGNPIIDQIAIIA